MLEVGGFEAKNTLGTLLDRVEGGEEVLITRHGRPVARLVPSAGGIDRAPAAAAIERIHARASALKKKVTWEELKQGQDAGRP